MQKSSAQQQQQPEVASAEGQQVTITLQHHGQLEENFAQANDTYLHHHHHSHQANVFLDPLFGATTETFKIKPSMSVCIHITYLPRECVAVEIGLRGCSPTNTSESQ